MISKKPSGNGREWTSIIELSNVGPIVYRKLPVIPGVIEVIGRCGSGKSILLNSIRTVMGADIPLVRNDDATEATVAFDGATVRFAKRQTRSGDSMNDLGVVHIEDSYDISQIVDPGMKSDETNDAVRIKALVQCAGVQIPFTEFQKIVPPADAEGKYEAVSIDIARKESDPVSMASKVKRLLDAEALRIERLADEIQGKEDVCLKSLEGIDLNQPHDETVLRKSHVSAVQEASKLQEQKAAADRAKQARESAKAKLSAAGKTYAGPTVREAEIALQKCDRVLTAAKSTVEELQRQLREAEQTALLANSEMERARLTLKGAEDHERLISEWTGALSAEMPDPPSPDDIAGAEAAVQEAEQAAAVGVQVRAGLVRQEEAILHRRQRLKHSKRAKQLRDAAAETEAILSRAVKFDSLFVKGGRLIYRHEDGKEELFQRLSDGQRWREAIKIGAQRVGEKGDGTQIMVLPQRAWESLDPDIRQLVFDEAIAHGMTIYTGRVDSGDLRAVLYGTDVDLCAELAEAK